MRELAGYTEELRKNRDKVAELRNIEGCDPARIRQWVSVAAETEAMIPDTANRLANAVQDLRNFLGKVREDRSISDHQALAVADEALAAAESVTHVQ
mmetsp:Transcript_550/g.1082  ORF Transcript_550/g.1082 Transcript_550/m.1082 type:complete len:97 (-) Transcript_550:1381-1671(-)